MGKQADSLTPRWLWAGANEQQLCARFVQQPHILCAAPATALWKWKAEVLFVWPTSRHCGSFVLAASDPLPHRSAGRIERHGAIGWRNAGVCLCGRHKAWSTLGPGALAGQGHAKAGGPCTHLKGGQLEEVIAGPARWGGGPWVRSKLRVL